METIATGNRHSSLVRGGSLVLHAKNSATMEASNAIAASPATQTMSTMPSLNEPRISNANDRNPTFPSSIGGAAGGASHCQTIGVSNMATALATPIQNDIRRND